MIGRLSGLLILKNPAVLLVDVGGVGYEVFVSLSTLEKCPAEGLPVVLWIHHVVREDAQILYGFDAESERYIFRELIKISGVGPKLALTILSGVDPATFVHAIDTQDSSRLVALPGVGKKTADRLLVEMRNKLQQPLWPQGIPGGMTVTTQGSISSIQQEAISALIGLGYKPQEAAKSVTRVSEEGDTVEVLLRKVLKGNAPCTTNV
jgi:Holliday junction DNA helicase RuvA